MIPENLWELALATSAAILLIGGAATLLFKVARLSYLRKDSHEREADFTRQIEVAVRLALSSTTKSVIQHEEVARAFRELAIQLVKRPETPPVDSRLVDDNLLSDTFKAATTLREHAITSVKK